MKQEPLNRRKWESYTRVRKYLAVLHGDLNSTYTRDIGKWLVIAPLIGILSGAVILGEVRLILQVIWARLLPWYYAHHWLMIPGVSAGFGAPGLIMRYLTPDPDLHSTDEVIRSYHDHHGDMDLRSYWPKMLACGVSGEMDVHMARGMYGMIVVEPEQGLPRVDREFYLGQNETYTKQPPGNSGSREFDSERLLDENPTYVTFSGSFNAITSKEFGAMKAKVGETVRIFLVNGGPNLLSSLHPVGNIWSRVWFMGAFATPAMRFLQSVPVPPGNAIVAEMELPVPQTTRIVDHSMTRAMSKGAMAEMEVSGEPNAEVFKA
jgi:hypothetical protein